MKLLKKILRKTIRCTRNCLENLLISRSKKNEIKKFKDKRRVSIYSKINLSKEQKKQIDDFYITNYGKKIPYTWHRHYTAFTGNFDPMYFPELLYIPVFERFMNFNTGFRQAMGDKNFLSIIAKGISVKMPQIIISCASGLLRDYDYNVIGVNEAIQLINNKGVLFVKPTVGTSSGRGCILVDIKDNYDIYSNKRADVIIKEMGDDFVVQERLICHESIRNIYSESVNTFRIITYRWKNGIFHMPIIMRIGQGGSHLDNAHAGGMFIALDDDGTMHKTAFTEFKKEFTQHPDTGFTFDGNKIILLPDVLKAAKKMHEAVPELGVINWDFTIDKEGTPVLIEANVHAGGIWPAEMSHGHSCFGENTADVLRWIRQQEKLSYYERNKYAFGKMKGESNDSIK